MDYGELSEVCARSLTVRSKHSSLRTWSQKWKRDSWTQLLFGRILKPSRSENFADWWTSFLGDTRARRSPQQESERERTIQDTSGHGSQMEFDFASQDSVSSRMSMDTSRWDSPQSSATWKEWVTRCRGEYSARLKSALHIKGSECSSSPPSTPWPTPNASDSNARGTSQGNRKSPNLPIAVLETEKMWPTANARDWKDTPGMSMTGVNPDGSKRKREDQLPRAVYMCGRRDQDTTSTGGSHPELWRTPNANVIEAKTEGIKLSGRTPQDPQVGLADQVLAERRSSWPTPVVTDAAASGNRNLEGSKAHSGESLTDVVRGGQSLRSRDNTERLNPRWVETLMGLPVGWAMPSCTHPSTTGRTN